MIEIDHKRKVKVGGKKVKKSVIYALWAENKGCLSGFNPFDFSPGVGQKWFDEYDFVEGFNAAVEWLHAGDVTDIFIDPEILEIVGKDDRLGITGVNTGHPNITYNL